MSRRGLVLLVLGLSAPSFLVPCGVLVGRNPHLAAWTERHAIAAGCVAVLGVWACAAWRVALGLLDPPRPQWVVRYVDLPATVVWASGVLGLPVALFGGLIEWGWRGGPTALSFELGLSCGLLGALWGVIVRRKWVKVRELGVVVRALPRELDGYRVAQLSDLHLGSVDTCRVVRAWVRRTNALECDMVAITGDLVTSGTRFYAAVAEVVGELRARDGVYVINGNHDLWSPSAWRRELEARGLRVLSHEATMIRRGEGALVLVGLDATGSWAEARNVLRATQERGPQIVLAHYPEAYQALGELRPALVLSGHTHGGQIALPWIDHRANLTRLMGGPVSGLTESGDASLYVSRGLGTTGIPLRLGAAPEITVITLKRAEDAD